MKRIAKTAKWREGEREKGWHEAKKQRASSIQVRLISSIVRKIGCRAKASKEVVNVKQFQYEIVVVLVCVVSSQSNNNNNNNNYSSKRKKTRKNGNNNKNNDNKNEIK